MTSPKFKLIESFQFLLSWLLQHLKTFIYTNYWFQRVLRFAIKDVRISRLLRDAAFSWECVELAGGRESSYVG